MALPAGYHYKQANVLARLALGTRDVDTASALMRLAAEHATLADEAELLMQLMYLAAQKKY